MYPSHPRSHQKFPKSCTCENLLLGLAKQFIFTVLLLSKIITRQGQYHRNRSFAWCWCLVYMIFQITGLPAWVFAFLASKRFLTSVWYFSPLGRLQEKLHSLQAKGFSPACCSMCFKWMSMTFLAPILKTEMIVIENYCPIIRLFSRVDSHVDSKPASLIARVVALWTNKGFLSAVSSHVGFQIGKFGTE